jgi:glycosyltransferase involved in cell wall biosynthesis
VARILVVKAAFPYPPSQGTRRVSLALLRDLATAHEVVYLTQLERREERALVPHVERLGVRVVAPLMPNHVSPVHRALYKAKNRLISRLTGAHELSLYWSNAALRSRLGRLGRSFRPDLTILESWETHPLRRSIRGGRAALLAHDAAFRILERAVAAAGADGPERARREARLRRLKRQEIAAWAKFDAILTLTEDDRDTILGELTRAQAEALGAGAGTARLGAGRSDAGPGARLPLVRHLPVPVPEEFFEFARPATPGRRLGFLGTFRADFNRDALAFLLREVWPAIRARVPDASLAIAGNSYRGPLADEARAAGARWLGFVADLGAYFGEIDVLLVPLRFGGGVRIRILEALAAGTPVIATPIAAAGLGVADGEHLAIAEGPDALAARAERLLTHPTEAAELGRRGRAWCATHHGAAVLRARRLVVIDEVLHDTARRERLGDRTG